MPFYLIELEDFHELDDSKEYYESLEYLLFFDYIMATEILEEGHVNYLVMERNIAHKFSVGMILTGDFSTVDDESFFACWRREIVDLHEIEKVDKHLKILTANRLHFIQHFLLKMTT